MPVNVQLWASVRAFAEGQDVVTVDAHDIRSMLAALEIAYPGMAPLLANGVSVAIDGEIYTDNLIEKVGPENEVVLMQKLSGG